MFPIDLARLGERVLSTVGANVTLREIADLGHAYPAEINADILDWVDATAS
jgi:phospholipase/carboxylesterase